MCHVVKKAVALVNEDSRFIRGTSPHMMSGMPLLAQLPHELAPPADGGIGFWFSLHMLLLWGTASLLTISYGLFWLWMMIQCLRSEPDKYFWIWLLIVAPFPGAIVYAVVRHYPSLERESAGVLGKWTRGKELARLQAAAEQIGNAHQYVQWGDALREVGRWDGARAAYQQALKKEPANLPALWGASLVAQHHQQWADVERWTRSILDRDPQYKFGDVSLLAAISLAEQGKAAEARAHLEQHTKRWRQPEAMYRLAELCHAAGDDNAARDHLRAMLQDLNASPPAIARKYGRWKSRAKKLLKTLPS